jgi:probable HAF family extracellular repeat protein
MYTSIILKSLEKIPGIGRLVFYTSSEESRASCINDSGQIVGWADTEDADRCALVWANGVMSNALIPQEFACPHLLQTQDYHTESI